MADNRLTNLYLTSSATKSNLTSASALQNLSLSSSLLSNSQLNTGATSTKLNLSAFGASSSFLSSSVSNDLRIGATSSKPKSKLESGFLNLKLGAHIGPTATTKRKRVSSPGRAVPVKYAQPVVKKSTTTKRRNDHVTKTEKKKKVEGHSGKITAEVIKQYTIDRPSYSDLNCDDEYFEPIKRLDFIPPSADMSLVKLQKRSLADVTALKRGLINCVSGSLISMPRFTDKKDLTRQIVTDSVNALVDYDPEFILKIALYSRKELNIRTTSNFLLALAANISDCRQYLKKYYCASIALPSDWMEVAEIYQTLNDKNLKAGALPTALRKVMITKFNEFDEYVLAKYNKESSGKKKKRMAKKVTEGAKSNFKRPLKLLESDSSESEDEGGRSATAQRQISDVSYDEKISAAQLKHEKFTIKQLIRKLHITAPVKHIMCIIGRKYPDSIEKFYQSRLPGVYEEENAGKRMKLAIPETWETQVSLKGNKAKTWEDLIDHKKLPFMAMLRNLRNLIKAGISEKHHSMIIRRLTDKRQVVNSKQFPFRFFSAYAVLKELSDTYEQNQRDIIEAAEERAAGRCDHGRGRGRGAASLRARNKAGIPQTTGNKKTPWYLVKRMKKVEEDRLKEVPYDKALIERYTKALDTAVKIATTYNVQPIKGRTIIFCDISTSMDVPCSSAKGLGKPRTLREISTLMSLMCQHACEASTFIVFNENGYHVIEQQDDSILDRLQNILDNDDLTASESNRFTTNGLPFKVLMDIFKDKVQVDNLLLFSRDLHSDVAKATMMNSFLCQYRRAVNPNLLFVAMNFSSPKPGFDAEVKPPHENDIFITGYSDAILRFIAERGDSGLLQHVDKIDTAFQLRPMPKAVSGLKATKPAFIEDVPRNALRLAAPKPRWQTVRVFISSTFRDMHGERDLITRFIFPELRSILRQHFINMYEVDMRWGITEEDSRHQNAVVLCLEEVKRCQLFIGLLGERYGWIPEKRSLPVTPELSWVQEYDVDASLTEMEMYAAALSKPDNDGAFFFFRDNSFERDVPSEFVKDFKSEDSHCKKKIDSLKQRIKKQGYQVYDNYPCQWGGFVDGKPIVSGLTDFGSRMLSNLINEVKSLYASDVSLTEDEHINNQHWGYVDQHSVDFVGRSPLIKQIIGKIKTTSYGVIGLVGKIGSGKTALMSATIKSYLASNGGEDYNILINMSGAASGSNNLAFTLRRLAHLINSRFSLGYTLPEDFKNLVVKFEDLLSEAAGMISSKLVLFMDGLDQMENSDQPTNLEWLPVRIPDNVVIVMTACEGDILAKSLTRIEATQINIGNLDMWDKAEIVRQTLAKYSKTLSESGFGNEMKLLMLKREAHNPLYLKFACEELRVFGVFEKIADKLKSLPHTTSQMLQEILIRLENDHSKDLICLSLSLLACSREGLYAEELYELIQCYRSFELNDSFRPEHMLNMHFPNEDNLMPPVTFVHLTRSIMSFLNPGSTWSPVLSLSNTEIQKAVKLRYMKSKQNWEEQIHKLLAGFFWMKADPYCNKTWKGEDPRAFVLLPYHLACAHAFTSLESVLCSHDFIQVKCQLGEAASLLDDFELKGSNVKDKDAAKFASIPRVSEYKSFVSRNIEILVKYPCLALQQALNEPNSSRAFIDAVEQKGHYAVMPSHMLRINKPDGENQCYRTLSNLKMVATCIKVSPSGSTFATGSQDAVVRLYDKDTGKELKSFVGHSDTITDLCFVGNRMLCSASADNTLSIWDVEFGHRIHLLKSHHRRVSSCAADSTGQLIASGSWDGSAILWNAATGKSTYTFDIGSPVNSVFFHPEHELLATGSWDSKIRIFNTFHQKRVAVLNGHCQSVRDVVFSKDGLHLASADIDGDVKIWDSKKGTVVGSVKGHSEPINQIMFSPTGKELVTASNDHQVKVWSSNLGIPMHHIEADIKLGAATSVDLSKDGNQVAVGYHSGVLRLYSVQTGVLAGEVRVSKTPIRVVYYWSYDGGRNPSLYLLVGCDDGNIQIVNVKKISVVGQLTGHSQPVLCVAAKINTIISGGEDCSICLYTFSEVCSGTNLSPDQIIRYHVAPVTSLQFLESSSEFVSASRDCSMAIHSQKPKPLNACHADWINCVSYDSNLNMLASGSNDFNIKLWSTEDYSLKCELKGHGASVNSLAFDSGFVVSGSSDNTVKVWSHKGVAITTFHGHELRVNACALYTEKPREESSKGNKLLNVKIDKMLVASASDDGSVWLLKPLMANQLTSLTGHSNRVLSISADKQGHVTSCSLDGSVKMWKPQLKEEANETVHDAPVNFIEVSTGGSYAVSGSSDGVVKVWRRNASTQLMEVKSTFQAHRGSVTCCSFVWGTTTVFMTGGTDEQLIEWEIKDQRNSFIVREKNRKIMTGLIVCMYYEHLKDCLYVATVFSFISISSSGQSMTVIQSSKTLDTWFTCITRENGNESRLVCGTSKNTVEYFDPENSSGRNDEKIVISKPEEDTNNLPNWIHCLSLKGNEGNGVAGDSCGQLSIFGSDLHAGKKALCTFKIHKSDITCLEWIDEETLFTGSKDATIKIAQFNDDSNGEYVQIGQFFCDAPVTSMKSVSTTVTDSHQKVHLMAGDSLGNIYQLKWLHNSSKHT